MTDDIIESNMSAFKTNLTNVNNDKLDKLIEDLNKWYYEIYNNVNVKLHFQLNQTIIN